jgi:integrase
MTSGSGKTKSARPLNHRVIEALAPETVPYRVPDQRCPGLAVRVAVSGGKTFDFSFRIKGMGKGRRLSLGSFGDVTLEQARARASDLRKAGRSGRDLIAEERQARAIADSRLTVDRLIEQYIRRRVAGRLRSAAEMERRLKRSLANQLQRPAQDLRRRDIREHLDAVADRGLMREAEKRRQTIGAMFRWALSQDLVEIDPTAGLASYGPVQLRDRVLSAPEIETLWRWSEAAMPLDVSSILRLQLALGARCGEIAGMHAEEVDTTTWLWTLPAERSKNKKPRVTPLIGIAREIISRRLEMVPRGLLFTASTGRPLTSSYVGHALLNRTATLPMAAFRTHDLRRTVATHMVELELTMELVASVIGHEAGSSQTRTLVRHYIRTDLLDRKRAALEVWDGRLREIISGVPAQTNLAVLAARD